MPDLYPAILGHEGQFCDPRRLENYPLHLFSSQRPRLTVREGAGIVLKIGAAVENVSVGDSVLLSYSSCGSCKCCRNQETSYCKDFEQRNFGIGREDGSKAYSSSSCAITSHFFGQSIFAKYAVVMASCVVEIDQDLPLNVLAPLGWAS